MKSTLFKKRLVYALALAISMGSVTGLNQMNLYASEGQEVSIDFVEGYADQVYSVEEATQIANGTIITVEGYLVGDGDVIGGAKGDTSLRIADSKYEIDKANTMPVQLPSGSPLRKEWGLKSNPSLIGTKVRVTGKRETYFSGPGIKETTTIVKADSSDNGQVAIEMTATPAPGTVVTGTKVKIESTTSSAITYTKNGDEVEDDGSGIELDETGDVTITAQVEGSSADNKVFEFKYIVKDLADHKIQDIRDLNQPFAQLRGVVTRRADTIKDGKTYTSLYVQDETSGMYIYSINSGAQDVAVGDEVFVEGKYTHFNNLQQFTDAEVTKLGTTAVAVEPVEITIDEFLKNGEKYESKLIKFTNIELGEINYSGATAITDGTNTVNIQKIPEGIEVGYDVYDVIAMGSQFKDDYQLTVVHPEDLIPMQGKKALDDIIVKQGEKFELPQTVTVVTDGVKEEKTITWDAIDEIDTQVLGQYTLEGTLESGEIVTVQVVVISKEGIRISDIQGRAHRSPFEGQKVADVEGVVTTLDGTYGFYMQSLTPDDDEKTSEGIYVKKSSHNVKPGDVVKASGTVEEVIGYTTNANSDKSVQLKATQINAANVKKETTADLPEPIIIGKGGREVPNQIIDNDGFAIFDPEEDTIDFYESLEGMLVAVNDAVIVGGKKYDEIPVVADRGANSLNGLSPNGGVVISEETMHPEILMLGGSKIKSHANVMVGDVFDGTLQGVLSYNDGNYKLVVSENLPQIEEHKYDNNPKTTLTETENGLRIASFNVENLGGNAAVSRFNEMAAAIAGNLEFPDIIALQEVQDNDGATDNGVVEGNMVYEKIIAALEMQPGAEGINYEYIEIAPNNNEDGGAPGGNIRVGMIYRTDRVQLVAGQKGDSTTATKVVKAENGTASLTLNPGRVEPQSLVFKSTRKSLAAEFLFNGEKVIVINNHLSSKGGDDPLFGNNQPSILHSEVNRIEQAKVVNNFVKEILSVDKNAKVVVLGDMNDYQFSNPLKALEGKELYNMINKLDETERYTYSYQGKSQVLDNILVTKGLEKATDVEILHINSTKGKGVQISDHDPVLIRVNMDQIKVEDNNNNSGNNNGDSNSDSSTGGGSGSGDKDESETKPETKPETKSETVKPEVTPVQKVQVTISPLQNKIIKDGKEITLTVTPFLEKGRVIAGIRDMSTLLGIADSDIIWDHKTKTVTIKGKDISLMVGKTYALVKGKKVELGVAPRIVKDRVILPIAHIGRILGMEVEFNPVTKEITIMQ